MAEPELTSLFPRSGQKMVDEAAARTQERPVDPNWRTLWPRSADKMLGAQKPAGAAPAAPTLPVVPAADRAQEPPAATQAAPPEIVPAELEIPEGIDPKGAATMEFKKIAAEMGLDNGKAGRLLKFYSSARTSQAAATFAGWESASRSDFEVGGAFYDESLRRAREVVTQYADRETAQEIAQIKALHPGWFKLLVRVSRALEGR
jgi:hypothetical protein